VQSGSRTSSRSSSISRSSSMSPTLSPNISPKSIGKSISGSPRSFGKGGSMRVTESLPESLPEGNLGSSSSDSNDARSTSVEPIIKPVSDKGGISFTEFLRVNMRLAEDRILSFVCVFSTGFGTKWIPGATFFYQPEIRWETLLTQRRRWLNGTFASFLFFFNSKRASDRIKGGMFDSHKAGKNIRLINGLWSLQLMQLLLVLVAPAVFGSASYIGLLEMADNWNYGFGWARCGIPGMGPIRVAEVWIFSYFFVYVVWTFRSFYAPRGRMPEVLCRTIAIAGFFVILPVYMSVWWNVATQGLDVINVLVIGSLGLPVVIAVAQSVTSAMLYLFYLPWFMFLIVFFLVYIPSYSFARLWDTTWGNRATGNDSAITDNMVDIMKTRNFVFICFLTTLNCGASWAFIGVFKLGYSAVLGFMLVVFFPMIIQLIFSFVFLFLAVPMRYLGLRPNVVTHGVEEYGSKSVYSHNYNHSSEMEVNNNVNPLIQLSGRSTPGSSGAAEDLETGSPAVAARFKSDPQPAAGNKVTFQRGI